jgi:hypothetical protein
MVKAGLRFMIWIRIIFESWIRIRITFGSWIQIRMKLHYFWKLDTDPDPYGTAKLLEAGSGSTLE